MVDKDRAFWPGRVPRMPEAEDKDNELREALINELIIIGQSDPLFIYEDINKRINQLQKERDSTHEDN